VVHLQLALPLRFKLWGVAGALRGEALRQCDGFWVGGWHVAVIGRITSHIEVLYPTPVTPNTVSPVRDAHHVTLLPVVSVYGCAVCVCHQCVGLPLRGCAGAEAEYQAMQVLCLVATVEDDPQNSVASQVIVS
jgi:hypothetical protein